jgi:hypothetical protein
MYNGASVEDQSRNADLGILFVHGIGRQTQGKTLLAAAGPLVEWLKKQNDNLLSIETAYLKPGREPGRPPAHAVVQGSINGNAVRLLLAESWWAEEFYPPPPLEFASWLLRFGAWILLRHAAELVFSPIDRSFVAVRRLGLPGHPSESDAIFFIAAVTGPLLFALAIVPFQLCVLFLAVLSLIPFFKIGEHAAKGLRFLAEVIGDSYVYASDPMSREAVHTRIYDDLRWLKDRAEHVTIIAHSQGAAAAVDMLCSRKAECGLITYGAGVRKLRELEYQKENPSFGFSLTQLSWVYSIGCIWALPIAYEYFHESSIGFLQNRPEARTAFCYLVFGAFLAYFVTAFNPQHTERIDDELLRIANRIADKGIPWTDLTATADPVPGGLLFRTEPSETDDLGWITWRSATWPEKPGLRSAWVRNTLSSVSDHTSYWKSHDDFLPRVVATLETQSSTPLTPPGLGASLRSASVARAVRGALRWWLHSLLFVMSVVVYYRLGSSFRLWLHQLLGGWLGKVDTSSGMTHALVDFSLWVVGLAVHILAVWLWVHFLSGTFWRSWDKGVRDPNPKQRVLAYLRLLGFLLFIAAGAGLMWVALQQGSYSAIPREVVGLVFRVCRAFGTGLLIHIRID